VVIKMMTNVAPMISRDEWRSQSSEWLKIWLRLLGGRGSCRAAHVDGRTIKYATRQEPRPPKMLTSEIVDLFTTVDRRQLFQDVSIDRLRKKTDSAVRESHVRSICVIR
jgi:hypothetical protein